MSISIINNGKGYTPENKDELEFNKLILESLKLFSVFGVRSSMNGKKGKIYLKINNEEAIEYTIGNLAKVNSGSQNKIYLKEVKGEIYQLDANETTEAITISNRMSQDFPALNYYLHKYLKENVSSFNATDTNIAAKLYNKNEVELFFNIFPKVRSKNTVTRFDPENIEAAINRDKKNKKKKPQKGKKTAELDPKVLDDFFKKRGVQKEDILPKQESEEKKDAKNQIFTMPDLYQYNLRKLKKAVSRFEGSNIIQFRFGKTLGLFDRLFDSKKTMSILNTEIHKADKNKLNEYTENMVKKLDIIDKIDSKLKDDLARKFPDSGLKENSPKFSYLSKDERLPITKFLQKYMDDIYKASEIEHYLFSMGYYERIKNEIFVIRHNANNSFLGRIKSTIGKGINTFTSWFKK